MKNSIIKIVVLCILAVLPLSAQAQKKVYTRKARLQDVPTKVLKVVGGNGGLLETTFCEEVYSRWSLSPYEFCSTKEYERLRTSANYYFLRLISDDGIVFISLEKGGKDGDASQDSSFEVVRVPVCATGETDGREFTFMPVFIDVLQKYVEDAMRSDVTAYSGLGIYSKRLPKGVEPETDPWRIDKALAAATPGVYVEIVIVPAKGSSRKNGFKMRLAADTHELVYFGRSKL